MAYVDVKLFRSYIGAVLPVFTHSHASDYSNSSLCPWHGDAIRDLRFGDELGFLGIIFFAMDTEPIACTKPRSDENEAELLSNPNPDANPNHIPNPNTDLIPI